MPSISEIIDSVSVPSLIKDEVIKNGIFEKSGSEPVYYSGGFTVVFPVTTTINKWAFRCWHTEMGNVRERFKVISDYINGLNSPYFCDFYYCDNGLIVDGKLFPTTRMKWVNGNTINEYIIKNSKHKEKLLSLAEKFLAMTEFLHSYKIAHGDLQHGNIIIENDEIKLVDYDSLFVPGLEGQSDIITGKAEFQHPNRSKLKIASEKLDYFSELVIYLSIIAIAHKPTLLNDFSIQDSLLFQADDWENFENSKIFKAISEIKDDDTTLLLSILNDYLKGESIDNLRPFDELWKQLLKEPIIHSFVCGNVDGIVFRNQETRINLEVENFSTITINGTVIPNGQLNYSMKFSSDTEIVLSVKNGLHKIEQSKRIKVVDTPKISFNANKKKLKKTEQGIEPLYLNWRVKNASSVSVVSNGKVLSSFNQRDKFETNPTEDSVYELIAIGLDNITEFRSKLEIAVREPAKVEFTADKLFTLPNVPVTVFWDLNNAKNVKLNGGNVPVKGKSNFTSKKDEIYKLTFEDEFGKHSKEIEVKMLPLPVIETIMVETPNTFHSVDIQVPGLAISNVPNIPNIQLDFVNLEMINVPDLRDSGLFVELPKTPQIKLMTKMSNFVKRILTKKQLIFQWKK